MGRSCGYRKDAVLLDCVEDSKSFQNSSIVSIQPWIIAASPSKPSREEVDSRSVFVGNVKYCCTIDELDQHFQSCGTVKKVTVGTDLNGKSKGFAFVEFLEPEAVQKAFLLNDSVLHGRQLKVSAKRTNIPGMRQSSGSQHFIHSTGYRSKLCLNPIRESLMKLEKKIPSKSSSFIAKDNATN